MPSHEIKISHLLLVSILCFICFLLGWMAGVFVVPGHKLKQKKPSFVQIKNLIRQEDPNKWSESFDPNPVSLKRPAKGLHITAHNQKKPSSTQTNRSKSLNPNAPHSLTQTNRSKSSNPLLDEMENHILFLMNPYTGFQENTPFESLRGTSPSPPWPHRLSQSQQKAGEKNKASFDFEKNTKASAPLMAPSDNKNKRFYKSKNPLSLTTPLEKDTQQGSHRLEKPHQAEKSATPQDISLENNHFKPSLSVNQKSPGPVQSLSSKKGSKPLAKKPLLSQQRSKSTQQNRFKMFEVTSLIRPQSSKTTQPATSPSQIKNPAPVLNQNKKEVKLTPQPAPSSSLKKLQKEYQQKNQQQLTAIEKKQKFFKNDGQFSFFLNAFTDSKKAITYAQDMKNQYPLWSFLLKLHSSHTRVYIGPFRSRQLAEEFKQLWLKSPAFENTFLEEISL